MENPVAHDPRPWRSRTQARDTLPTPVTSQTLETMDRVTPTRPYCAHEETMKDHGPHSEGKTTGPKRVTPKAPVPPIGPIVLMIGIRAHDGRPWETTGPKRMTLTPAPNGPNCAHDRRPCETAGPKRVIPASDHRPERVIPTRLMIGDHGPNCAHDRRPWETAGPKRVTPAHDHRPERVTPTQLMIGDHGRPQARSA